MGSAVTFHNQMTSARIERRLRHVAHGGLDHYQVRWVIDGAYRSTCRGRTVDLRSGSIGVCDMGEEESVEILPPPGRRLSRSVVFYLSRNLVSPWLDRPDAVGSTVIPGETAYGALIHAHFVELWRSLPRLSPLERDAALAACGVLLAGGIGHNAGAAEPLERTHRDARLAAVKRYVRAHLASEDLDIATLAARFGMSRATLCRLFEPGGGVRSYVQGCRLDRAFGTLASGARSKQRVLDVALECRFESESSFIRAFRRRFGITPGELLTSGETRHERSSETIHRWLETLSAPTAFRRQELPEP